MGPHGSENDKHGTPWERKFQNATPPTNRRNVSNFFCIFSLMSSFLKIEILTNFIRFCCFHYNLVNMVTSLIENFNTLLIFQTTQKVFKLVLNFCSQWFVQNNVWDFLNFELLIFNNFFSKISNSPF